MNLWCAKIVQFHCRTALLAQTGLPARLVHKVMSCLMGLLPVPRFLAYLISGLMDQGAQIVQFHCRTVQLAQTGLPALLVHKVMSCLMGLLPVLRFLAKLISGLMDLGAQIVWLHCLTALLARTGLPARLVHQVMSC